VAERALRKTKEETVPPATDKKARRSRSNPVDLDRVIHERVRLAMVSALAVNESLSFNELKALLDTSDGNLSVHARRLEEAGYITCDKSFEGRVPRGRMSISPGASCVCRVAAG
jgi:DNA-binding transcriptional ArsR family regulator